MLKKYLPAILIVVVLILAGVSLLLNKFVVNKKIQLRTEEKSGNINILVMGRGGGTHEGPDLTDTIILAMINPSKNEVNLISLPRDLWTPAIKSKINSAYAKGQKDGKGLLFSKAVVEGVTGRSIDYVVVIDFSGFEKLIDYIGGIDVDVAHTLDDYSYPIEGKETETCGHPEEEIADFIATGPAEMDQWKYFDCRYKHIHVDSGIQHMDGVQALEFSRSRHGVGSEGSDFARSRRQNEVISAVRSKVLSLGIVLNPIKVLGIFNILKDNIDTNIVTTEFDDFINLAQKMQKAKTGSYVIDLGNAADNRYGLLKEAVPDQSKGYQYNLIPRVGDGNFSEIKDYLKCINEGHICEISDDGIIKDPLSPSPRSK